MSFYDSGYASAAAAYDNMEPPEPEAKIIGLCCICGEEICDYEDKFEVPKRLIVNGCFFETKDLVCRSSNCASLYMVENFLKEAEEE